jgi:lactoylglutathione lyase
MMKLAHAALWTPDLSGAASFWEACFGATIGAPYHSQRRHGFISRFATLPGGLQIELMTAPWIEAGDGGERQGWDHIAISLGSRVAVDEFAMRSRKLGYLEAEPRETGDGFYEAIVRAPDGTRIEVTS